MTQDDIPNGIRQAFDPKPLPLDQQIATFPWDDVRVTKRVDEATLAARASCITEAVYCMAVEKAPHDAWVMRMVMEHLAHEMHPEYYRMLLRGLECCLLTYYNVENFPGQFVIDLVNNGTIGEFYDDRKY